MLAKYCKDVTGIDKKRKNENILIVPTYSETIMSSILVLGRLDYLTTGQKKKRFIAVLLNESYLDNVIDDVSSAEKYDNNITYSLKSAHEARILANTQKCTLSLKQQGKLHT